MLVKLYGSTPEGEMRYSPADCSGARKTRSKATPILSTSARLSRSVKPHDENAHAEVHEAHQCVLKESRKPRSRRRIEFHVLQFRPHPQDPALTPATAAGVTDRFWEIGDIVSVIEAWEISEARTEPSFEIEKNKIGDGYFVRVTFLNGEFETIYGFVTKADAIKWIRCEAVVWLYEKRSNSLKPLVSR